MNTLLAISARWLLQMEPHGPMGPHHGHGGGVLPWTGAGATVVWQLVGLVVGLAVVLAGVYVVLTLVDNQQPHAGTDDALTVLRREYARGEIDEEEFERRAAHLSAETSGDAPPRPADVRHSE